MSGIDHVPGDLRWWREEDPERVAQAVASVVQRIADDDAPRVASLARALRLYGERKEDELVPAPYRLSWNLTRSIVRTARADLVQGPAPRPMFVTTGGDYDTQKRAQRLNKFVAGIISQTRFDATSRKAAMHSALLGDGIVKLYAEGTRVRIEKVFPWEIHVDGDDASHGEPRSLYQTRWMDRFVLAERFPEEADDIIRASSAGVTLGHDLGRGSNRRYDQLLVVEAWHLPSSQSAEDGRHVITTAGLVLLDERWEDDTFPFVRFSWSEPVEGFWSQGVADEVSSIQAEIDFLLAQRRSCIRAVAAPRVFVDRASKVATAQIDNTVGAIVTYSGRPPIFDVPRAVPPDIPAALAEEWSKGFQATGVSEMSAAAMRPAGLDSGKALRVHAEIQSKRFSDWQKDFQDFYLEVSHQVVRLMRRIAADNPSVEVVYHDKHTRCMERIAWSEADLDEDSYVLQVYPVSALPSEPAGRMAEVQEWVGAGVIPPEDAPRILGFPDLEAHNSLASAARDLLEQVMSRMLDDGVYAPPEPFWDLALMLRLGAQHYMRAQVQGVAEQRLALVRQFLTAVQALLTPDAPPPAPEAGPPPPDQMPPDAAAMPAAME